MRVQSWHAALAAVVGLVGIVGTSAVGAERSLVMEYSPLTMHAGGGGVFGLVAADFDLDGIADLAAADGAGVRVFHDPGAGGTTMRTISVGGGATALAVGDVDADGDQDLVVGLDAAVVVLANGLQGLSPVATYAMPSGDLGITAVRLADVDADGDLDVLAGLHSHTTATAWSGGLWVALGDGTGAFAALPTHDLAVPAADIVVADLDGDGALDVAELGGFGASSSTLALAFGHGDGTFSNGAVLYSAGLYAGAIAAADLDLDGDVDVVTGWKYSVSVRRNDGHGALGSQESFSVGAYVKGIATGDLDADGDVDLMATSGGSAGMHQASNHGDGTFAVTAHVPASSQCSSVLLVDTNDDGFVDPWSADVVTGQIHGAASHCAAAVYGVAKLNSLGCATTWAAQGTPSMTGSGFTLRAEHALQNAPALLIVGWAPASQGTGLGTLLVAPPWILVPTATSATGAPPCAGEVALAFTAAQLAAGTIGTKVHVQLAYADAQQQDGTGAALSDGAWFELRP